MVVFAGFDTCILRSGFVSMLVCMCHVRDFVGNASLAVFDVALCCVAGSRGVWFFVAKQSLHMTVHVVRAVAVFCFCFIVRSSWKQLRVLPCLF